ncbi:MAG: hypothetical protein SV186_02520 [Candidatus Nanohaloarchaea archaeon]|nr:hypothetical protein [Candidatus Nanohaloarchaea archaeon]
MPEDENKQRRLQVFKETFEELQQKVDRVEGELEELEESGDADRQPVKHQQAVEKVSEINEQLEKLQQAIREVEEGDRR